MRELPPAAKTVDGVWAALDLRHDPGNEKGYEQRDGFEDETALRGYLRSRVGGIWSGRVELAPDGVDGEDQGREKSNEDEQTPAGAEAVSANKNPAESRRRGWDWLSGRQRGVVMERLVVGFMVHRASSRDTNIYGGCSKLVPAARDWRFVLPLRS